MSKYVITHIKADFDAISSAWAVMRLHNCDGIIISSAMEANVRSFFKKFYGEELPPEIIRVKPKELDQFQNIETIYVTDCVHVKRVRDLAALFERAKEVVIYDHHMSLTVDIPATSKFIEPFGACATVVLKKLLNNSTSLPEKDAMLYLLGIYEDTGKLTLSNTTPDDLFIVAKIIELGGDVTVVRDYVKQDFTREQVFILNELLMNMETIVVRDLNITYSFAALEEYIPDMAFITQRMMEMEDLDALIVLVRSGPSIVAVGRSKNPEIDVSKVLAKFGGGGHAAAASANVKDLALHEAVELLKVTVREQIRPVRFLRELMTSPAKSLESKATITEALDFILTHNLNHMPITSEGTTVGIISRKDVMQAVKHGLNNEPVTFLMQVEFEKFEPQTPFRVAEYAMLANNQKLLPVEMEGKLIGVVTRTDLLRLMHEQSVERSSYEEGRKARLGLSRNRNVKDMLKNDLKPAQYTFLEEISEIAKEEGMACYTAGGFVRDLLMGLPNNDIDVVVEGNAVAIAVAYARLKKAKITIHDRYKTATVKLLTGEKFDFATSRMEYYCNPGAMPVTEISSIKNDMIRRDFTINAMAIRIDGSEFGRLIDYFGGQRDILDKKIRVLHSLSFVDDPTRAFRAIRFAARFDFKLGSHTERLIKNAEKLGLFGRINGSKLFIELKYILMEKKYFQALQLLKKFQMLHFIAINLNLNTNKEEMFDFLELFFQNCCHPEAKKVEIWMVRFVILMNDYIYPDFKSILENLHVERSLMEILLGIFNKPKVLVKKIKSMKAPKPSELYEMFSKLRNEELLMLGILLGESRSYIIMEYIEVHKHVKPALNGVDLTRLGIKPSKEMGEILKELLYKRLDGEITTEEQEIEYVRTRNN